MKEYQAHSFMGVTFINVPVGTVIRDERTGREEVISDSNYVLKGSDAYCSPRSFALIREKAESAQPR